MENAVKNVPEQPQISDPGALQPEDAANIISRAELSRFDHTVYLKDPGAFRNELEKYAENLYRP